MNDQKRHKEGAADIYRTLMDLVGPEDTELIFEEFRGQQVTFPKRFYKADYVAGEVKRRYDGTNLQELAKEFDYTDRHLRSKDMARGCNCWNERREMIWQQM